MSDEQKPVIPESGGVRSQLSRKQVLEIQEEVEQGTLSPVRAAMNVHLLTRQMDQAMAILQTAATLDHVDGCLFKSDRRMPCQCGFNEKRWKLERDGRDLLRAYYGDEGRSTK